MNHNHRVDISQICWSLWSGIWTFAQMLSLCFCSIVNKEDKWFYSLANHSWNVSNSSGFFHSEQDHLRELLRLSMAAILQLNVLALITEATTTGKVSTQSYYKEYPGRRLSFYGRFCWMACKMSTSANLLMPFSVILVMMMSPLIMTARSHWVVVNGTAMQHYSNAFMDRKVGKEPDRTIAYLIRTVIVIITHNSFVL